MLQRFRAIVVVTAMGAGALAMTPAASASQTSPGPDISKVGVNPNPVVVDSSSGATATFGFEAGATNAKVVLTSPSGNSTDVAATNGGSNKWSAQYKFTREDHKAGDWKYKVVATSAVGTSTSSTYEVKVRHVYDTRIVDFNASPENVRKGGTLTATGALQINWGKAWEGWSGQSVDISFREKGSDLYKKVATTTSGHNGWFKAHVKTWSSGYWRAEFNGKEGAHKSVSDADRIDVSRPAPPPEPEPEPADTRIVKFNASPEPVRYGRYVRLVGTLQVDDEWGWDGYRGKVEVHFKPYGSSKWRYVKSAWSTGSGKVRTSTRAYKSGTWRFYFDGDSDTFDSRSKGDYVKVRR
ncbi:hypothetical protein [Sinosporangium siamense]|uniref:Uncharacterized protein n=1 Tax=Sinosporangium siamense TaxID=1367973 RepID=A0A919RF74_9ACTN|nr:hypothetical protein [Sinosporangium siamense]GII92277.1 hypothetical protein Ssi02_25080 [Sinosporangium siamense]